MKLLPEADRLLDPRRARSLDAGWRLARTGAGACAHPSALDALPLDWHEAQVPGTVAACLHRDLDVPGDYDAHDWWYRTSFEAPTDGSRHFLRFEGLATLAEVWLNGEKILQSRNMFVPRRIDVTGRLRERNDLAIAFRALDAELARRRPRPRWKTRLVEKQALRWVRTTLLGRIPAWTPGVPAVGPWQPVVLESSAKVDVSDVSLRAQLRGREGKVAFGARVQGLDGPIAGARLVVGESRTPLAVDGERVEGVATVPDAPLWWPHTHGEPALLPCRLELDVGGSVVRIDCGRVGFRDLSLDTAGGGVRFVLNGTPVFCRGVAWTPLDILRLRATPEALREALTLLREAGANMIRVGGTMAYESDEFHALCDELGILVWQDFMFANMDYPIADEAFRAEAQAEARHHVRRLAAHPSLAAWCGGSEVAQQAAMNGLPREAWGSDFYERLLPDIVAELSPGTPYFPSSPWGGALPFHVGRGLAHYYGVGAYRRPLADVKSARVPFATECLGFSNVPEGTPAHVPHHPRWKARVPRDNGSPYDFEDVRDHYLGVLFGCDPVALRTNDLERYWAASRVTSGEVMARTYSEWRSPESGCGGALVWFHRDLWEGAGWGIVAADGTPKSPYWYLKRAWAPLAVRITDEGLDGLSVHVLNERDTGFEGRVEVEMFHRGRRAEEVAGTEVQAGPRSAFTLSVDALVGRFTDSANSYHFGPPKQDAVVARLRDGEGRIVSEDVFFPAGLELPRREDADLRTRTTRRQDGAIEVALRAETFLQAVAIESPGYRPDDNYFHLAPGTEKVVRFRPLGRAAPPFAAHFEPLNAPAASVRAQERADAA